MPRVLECPFGNDDDEVDDRLSRHAGDSGASNMFDVDDLAVQFRERMASQEHEMVRPVGVVSFNECDGHGRSLLDVSWGRWLLRPRIQPVPKDASEFLLPIRFSVRQV